MMEIKEEMEAVSNTNNAIEKPTSPMNKSEYVERVITLLISFLRISLMIFLEIKLIKGS